MRLLSTVLGTGIMVLTICCAQKKSFHDQIVDDVVTKFGTLPCDSVPLQSKVTNVTVGEIVPIGDTGLIDVSIEFDIENNGSKKHLRDALLYSKAGDDHVLQKIGGCEYSANL
ncbi:hypothetical protein [Pseudochryseolinea flava]|uniref:Uncharacterized protein n=1 Tax=Pseudochryseolinea flava TaxID=2059302 RepID=A0A364XUA6_9BACT|nr:hypothetical protein [Pseudochryseolinea flava]RAV97748.1 hypothetical protein DQQ10_27015 [Pseudochryseolinea flava]